MQWKKIGLHEGTPVAGDKSVPPTRWWNHVWLVFFGWKMIVTFRVPKEVAAKGYFVGFTPPMGSRESWCKAVIQHDEIFSMRIGHEDCQFFVLAITKPEFIGTGIEQNPKLVLPEIIARGPLH